MKSIEQLDDITIGENAEMIVIDNASEDGSYDMIKQEFPWVKLLKSDTNDGFSIGNNNCVKEISETSEYVLFLNSDTTVPNGTISHMINVMDQDQSIGVSSCLVRLANGKIDKDCHRGLPTPWNAFTHFSKLEKLFPNIPIFSGYFLSHKGYETSHQVDALVGAFMLVRRSVGDQLGWWDEDYFLNGEDIDFCYRIKQAGYYVWFDPTVEITHYRGVSKGTRKEGEQLSNADQKRRNMVAHASVNAMSIFYNKHLRQKYPFFINWMVDVGLWGMRKVRTTSI